MKRGRLFTTERTMKMSKEDELLIVQNNKKCVHSSSKNRNYARSHKIGMSKLVMKVMGNVSTGLHNTKLARSNSIYAVSSRVATPV